MGKIIDTFDGEYRFLSNFYPAPLVFGWITFPTSEHAYQAIKSIDPDVWAQVAACGTPGKAKRMGKHINLRVGWDWLKLEFMEEILQAKFEQHPDLMAKLKATGDAVLIEGNH